MRRLTAGLLALAMLLIGMISLAEGSVAVGDKVNFGKYPQHLTSSGAAAAPEPIVWQVLAVDGNKALLLADQALIGMPYNSGDSFLNDVTWETCSLRAWLNGGFLNDAFSAEEQQAILPTAISTPDYRDNGFVIPGGNDTTDKVFLLSTDEVEKYLKTNKSRICCPTDYAVSTGAANRWGYYADDSYNIKYVDDVCTWWLRSPGEIGHYTACCNHDGAINNSGKYSGDSVISVRPAIWVRIDALSGT